MLSSLVVGLLDLHDLLGTIGVGRDHDVERRQAHGDEQARGHQPPFAAHGAHEFAEVELYLVVFLVGAGRLGWVVFLS